MRKLTYMKRIAVVLLCLIFLSVGCAGRNPVLIPVSNDTDYNMTCDELRTDIKTNEDTIMEKYYVGKKATSNTVAAAITGYFIIIPFLFMDLKKAEYKEMGNLQERRNHLIKVGQEKKCENFDTFETDDELMARGQAEYETKIKGKDSVIEREPTTINGRPQS